MRSMKAGTSYSEALQVDNLNVSNILIALVAESDDPSRLIEVIYYGLEDDLMTAIRLVAALEPADREKICELAKSIHDMRKA